MSYILDALRKSDQLRRRSGTPTLLQVPVEVAAPKQPAVILYAVIALLLLGLGIAIGWWRPWHQDERNAAPATGTQSLAQAAASSQAPAPVASDIRPQPSPAPVVPIAPAAPMPTAPSLTPSTSETTARSAPLQSAAAPTRSQPKAVAGPETLATKRAEPEEARPEPSVTAEAAALTPMKMSDLPLTIQQELPPLSISVHAYSSNPRDRLVGINGRLLHEGDVVAPGLKLEQIAVDGMILSYKGYTFRRGVN